MHRGLGCGSDRKGSVVRLLDDTEHLEDRLRAVIVLALAAYAIIALVAWVWMILAGVAVPPAFTTVLTTLVGGLVGLAGPLRPASKADPSGLTAPGPGSAGATARRGA